MSILLILLALALLIAGAWAGLSVLVLVLVLAAVATGAPVLAAYTQVFMRVAGGFVVSFFPLFLLGALFGKVMDASGAAQVLARALFAETGLPARLIPATIALGAFSFTMTALPGTASIQNAIPEPARAVPLPLWAALVLALALSRPPRLMKMLNDGAESALLPFANTASLVGFGAVIASLPGFEVLRQGLDGLSGGNVVVTAALSSGALAGITGSASGGMSIALDVLRSGLLQEAASQGVEPALLHRVVSVATGGLDTLPHNGAVVTLLGICGMTHRQAYGDILMVAVLGPALACALIIALGIAFGSF